MDDYKRGGHCKYSMKVHLIFVTKYRKSIFINNAINDDVKQYLYDAANHLSCSIIKMETDKNHVHILIDYDAKQSVSEIVKYIKQYSSYQLWKKYLSVLSKHYWKRKVLWSDGYFACSIGQVSQSIIEHYIENQG